MTNSIWHKANEKPELNKYVVVRKHGFAQWKVLKFDNKTTFFEPFTDDLWAYMADVITQADKVELQADKAERLQKEITQELDIYYSHTPGLHPADDCIYAIEKTIGYKKPKETQ